METAINQANSSHDIPLAMLVESPTNPRQHFDETGLSEMAETIRKVGVYQAILVRPKAEKLEIVFGARRYRASALAEKDTIPGIIREMTDAEVLEAQLVELSIVVKRVLSVFAGLHVVDMSTTCGFAS